MNPKDLCAKQTVIAVVVNHNRFYIGSNWVNNPQTECPRKNLPSGQGYHLCKDVCNQHAHAEVDACMQAGADAQGATLYLIGHDYCCDDCLAYMKSCGIKEVRYCAVAPVIPMTELVIDSLSFQE